MQGGEKSVLARATLNGLVVRVVARGPPVAHPCSKHLGDMASWRCLWLTVISGSLRQGWSA